MRKYLRNEVLENGAFNRPTVREFLESNKEELDQFDVIRIHNYSNDNSYVCVDGSAYKVERRIASEVAENEVLDLQIECGLSIYQNDDGTKGITLML